jgi:hypothetical protein
MTTNHGYTVFGDDVDLLRALLRTEYKRIQRESPDAFESASAGSWVTRVASLCRALDCVPRL